MEDLTSDYRNLYIKSSSANLGFFPSLELGFADNDIMSLLSFFFPKNDLSDQSLWMGE